ncbi:hypothetical protein L249_5328 [Ophiocordyceps polyrhachis-furcata BCC 54312]|uniref:Uncharacterized protein n=1 Tax=Ophiocordyceps polyrhachis-furcata BCC 54312 TaxID=1330021 RepID=A0A367L8F4_9HYPO|nr:hypothetical protein L249_5328 [Ophiocordyceps polyrhachis-furcata BCC 54312]
MGSQSPRLFTWRKSLKPSIRNIKVSSELLANMLALIYKDLLSKKMEHACVEGLELSSGRGDQAIPPSLQIDPFPLATSISISDGKAGRLESAPFSLGRRRKRHDGHDPPDKPKGAVESGMCMYVAANSVDSTRRRRKGDALAHAVTYLRMRCNGRALLAASCHERNVTLLMVQLRVAPTESKEVALGVPTASTVKKTPKEAQLGLEESWKRGSSSSQVK